MSKENLDIRLEAMSKNIRMCDIARSLGILESNFSKLLRYELPLEKKAIIFNAINNLAREKENE